jgi:hypothetical protein
MFLNSLRYLQSRMVMGDVGTVSFEMRIRPAPCMLPAAGWATAFSDMFASRRPLTLMRPALQDVPIPLFKCMQALRFVFMGPRSVYHVF